MAPHRNLASTLEVLPEPLDLVHPFVEHRDDANISVAENFPVDEMLLIPTQETFNPELGRDRVPDDMTGGDRLEAGEQAANITRRLIRPPGAFGVAVDLVDPLDRGGLDPEPAHRAARARPRAITVSASRG